MREERVEASRAAVKNAAASRPPTIAVRRGAS
jgi:hypothetical protein